MISTQTAGDHCFQSPARPKGRHWFGPPTRTKSIESPMTPGKEVTMSDELVGDHCFQSPARPKGRHWFGPPTRTKSIESSMTPGKEVTMSDEALGDHCFQSPSRHKGRHRLGQSARTMSITSPVTPGRDPVQRNRSTSSSKVKSQNNLICDLPMWEHPETAETSCHDLSVTMGLQGNDVSCKPPRNNSKRDNFDYPARIVDLSVVRSPLKRETSSGTAASRNTNKNERSARSFAFPPNIASFENEQSMGPNKNIPRKKERPDRSFAFPPCIASFDNEREICAVPNNDNIGDIERIQEEELVKRALELSISDFNNSGSRLGARRCRGDFNGSSFNTEEQDFNHSGSRLGTPRCRGDFNGSSINIEEHDFNNSGSRVAARRGGGDYNGSSMSIMSIEEQEEAMMEEALQRSLHESMHHHMNMNMSNRSRNVQRSGSRRPQHGSYRDSQRSVCESSSVGSSFRSTAVTECSSFYSDPNELHFEEEQLQEALQRSLHNL